MSRWEPQTPSLGSLNAVLVARSRRHSVKDFPGPLSIKTVCEGKVAWQVDRRQVWVDDSSFLVLNDGEHYSMEIDAPEPVSTCCVFFEKGFVESIVRDISTPIAQCLEDPHSVSQTVSFLSRLHPRSSTLFQWMARIREHVLAASPAMEIDECYLNLASELLLHYEENRKQMARIPAARAPTRTELFSRVSRGREFLHAEAYGRITLSAAARAAGMSPFHFHRTFRQAFGRSPATYVTELRFARAARLLMGGSSVTDVCLAVGFESLGSFSTAFRKYYGVPPSSLRP
jgi:AraC family transcriptional regulator